MFQLIENEVDYMVSQNAIPSKQHLGGFLPYVFTEQGVAAVSAILKSEKAVQVSIQVVRAFVQMRKFILNNAQYSGIEVKLLTNSHDRFLIIDKKTLYHIGASLKDLGKKWFAFSKMDSLTNDVLEKLEMEKKDERF